MIKSEASGSFGSAIESVAMSGVCRRNHRSILGSESRSLQVSRRRRCALDLSILIENSAIDMPVAIITGAASGIGLALCRHFSSEGWAVVLADVNVEEGTRVAEELGEQAFFHKTDVSDWDDVASLFKKTVERFGGVDYVAANAGVADFQSLYEKHDGAPEKPNLKTIDINLNGQIYCLWLAAHYFRRNKEPGGTVVFTSSNAGLYKFPTNPQYAASKHGVCISPPIHGFSLLIYFRSLASFDLSRPFSRRNIFESIVFVQPLCRPTWHLNRSSRQCPRSTSLPCPH